MDFSHMLLHSSLLNGGSSNTYINNYDNKQNNDSDSIVKLQMNEEEQQQVNDVLKQNRLFSLYVQEIHRFPFAERKKIHQLFDKLINIMSNLAFDRDNDRFYPADTRTGNMRYKYIDRHEFDDELNNFYNHIDALDKRYSKTDQSEKFVMASYDLIKTFLEQYGDKIDNSDMKAKLESITKESKLS